MYKRIVRKIFSVFIDIIKYVPFLSVLRVRRFCYKFVLRKIGAGTNICDGVTMMNPSMISIGRCVSIHEYCVIGGAGRVTIGDNVAIASHCRIVSDAHNFSKKDILIKKQGVEPKDVVIGSNVWIGSHVTVLGGVNIAQGAVIGAGSVVTRDVPENAVAVGVPCKVIRFR